MTQAYASARVPSQPRPDNGYNTCPQVAAVVANSEVAAGARAQAPQLRGAVDLDAA